jgi:hypothetical protein
MSDIKEKEEKIGRLKVVAVGYGVNLNLDIEILSKDLTLEHHMTVVKNVIFDMLRSQNYDVENITFIEGEKENVT